MDDSPLTECPACAHPKMIVLEHVVDHPVSIVDSVSMQVKPFINVEYWFVECGHCKKRYKVEDVSDFS